MKKLLLFAIAMLCTSMAMAIPAHPGLKKVTQPDGTTLTIRLVGDEYLNFRTTADGYTIVSRADGFYAYAQLDDEGRLQPTDRIARDAETRSAEDAAWLQGIKKRLCPAKSGSAAFEQQAEMARRTQTRAATARHKSEYDYDNFRGLILLVEYNDRKFSREDYPDIVADMVNKEDYTGYDNTPLGKYTGSVRDYFYDNSMGIFAPQFDVVGPITIDYSKDTPNGTEKAYITTVAALEAADSLVDYSQYDLDKNGEVDMIYFIFAGVGANYGNGDGLLWPHQGQIWQPGGSWGWQYVTMDGVRMGRYACSVELAGYEAQGYQTYIDGIGVICHEFSHVLGLPDLYDTDYEKNGQSNDPDEWCIMAGGPYLNNARTPAGYSLYERYALGFATPEVISEEGSYELAAIGNTNQGYRLNTPVRKEFFLIENRQKSSKWDRYLPGHGMLVFRTDSTNTTVWRDNTVNANPNHNYFEMVRAKGGSGAKASDPFPGTGRVTELNNTTEPANLLTWAGKTTSLGFENITENDGIISFDIVDVNVLRSISLPETMTLAQGITAKITETRVPDYAPYTLVWKSSDGGVATIDANGIITARGVGQCTITVTANGDENLSAQCLLTVEELKTIADIASYKALDKGSEAALQLNNALVVFANDDNAFVRDETGAIQFASTGLPLQTGDQLNGMVYGRIAVVDGVPQLQPVDVSTNGNGYVVTKDNEVTPREVTMQELNDDYRADLITLTAVKLERKTISGKTGVWAVEDDRQVRLYNSYQLPGISLPRTLSTEPYDVTGLYITNKLSSSIIDEIQMTVTPTLHQEANSISSINDTDAQAVVYTADGRMVARTGVAALSKLSLPSGIYVVKTENRTWKIAM